MEVKIYRCPLDIMIVTNFPFVDPHYENIGIATPQIDQFNGFDLIDHIARGLKMSPVIPTDALCPIKTVPAYIVGTTSIEDFLCAQNAFPVDAR